VHTAEEWPLVTSTLHGCVAHIDAHTAGSGHPVGQSNNPRRARPHSSAGNSTSTDALPPPANRGGGDTVTTFKHHLVWYRHNTLTRHLGQTQHRLFHRSNKAMHHSSKHKTPTPTGAQHRGRTTFHNNTVLHVRLLVRQCHQSHSSHFHIATKQRHQPC
jgi:hypothetical protein